MVLDAGSHEPLKAAVHGSLAALVAVCLGYNTAAWIKRRETHLGVGSILYAGLFVWEVNKTVRHINEAQKSELPDALGIGAAVVPPPRVP